ncbi:hypothetical protein M422DRAFT_32727 [Sphaerobolus stellatus SS14]|uniref:SEC7 domain-containing protein n=1 Tax=Sphaerobolus stellatus (strain SS14) TaxID=990650 RepID=A0A0C9VN93_SPHS4|nr:hypothetical protein M422DRAFT_32727 [Sphaerobolus stellatus SS14]
MQPSNAEVRAAAVGRLKRAASLPRIKGGRRPPMHPEGTSEGEKTRDELSNSKQDEESKNVTADERDEPERPELSGKAVEVVTENQEQAEDGGVSEGPDHEDTAGPSNGFSPPPTPTRRKRRSRSRSRSRSKDLKELSKTPPPPEESSPEGRPNALPPFHDIPVASPMPSRPSPFAGVGRIPFLTPTAPSTPAPLTPMATVPTLQDLQQRYGGASLSRSQSASRAAAMLKLTGELPDEVVPSPTLSRSATISGIDQRAAARQRMLGRIQNRVGGNTDEALTSGGEDTVAPVITSTAKRRRRRSRKSSGPTAAAADLAVVDDRDPADLSASTDTPLVPPNALPESYSYPATPLLTHTPHPFLPPFTTPFVNGNHLGLDSSPSGPINLQQWTFQQLGLPYQEVIVHETQPQDTWQERDVVIEEEDSEASIPPRSPSPLPHQRLHHSASRSSVDEPREPRTSDALSSVSGQDIPVIMSLDSVPSPYKQDEFPRSPFHTPGKDRGHGEEEEDQILYDGGVEGHRSQNGRAATNGKSMEWQQYTEQEVPIQSEGDDDPEVPADRESPERQPPTSPSPGPENAYYPSASPSSAQDLSSSHHTRESVSSVEPDQTPDLMNLVNAAAAILPQPRESYTDIGTDYEDVQTDKESPDNKWSKWKTLVRANSFTGRRSRANSVTKREEKVAKRESGASTKDHGKSHDRAPSTVPPSAWSPNIATAQLSSEQARQAPPSASTSILSLPLSPHHRGGSSPMPPASPADLSRYGANDKLTPFPGLVKLDEERRKQQRTRRMSMSSPNLPHDIAAAAAAAFPSPNGTFTEDERRERKLSHQYSDTGLLQKFRAGTESAPSSSTNQPNAKSGGWLPTNRNELKIWYKLNRFFSASQTATPAISPKMISSPIIPDGRLSRQGTLSRPSSRQQKRTETLSRKPSTENTKENDDGISNQSATPKRTHPSPHRINDTMDLPHDSFTSPPVKRIRSQQDSVSSTDSFLKRDEETEPETEPSRGLLYSRPALSIIPKPIPSDQSWTISHTDSSISVPSLKPDDSPNTPVRPPQRTSVLMERLEVMLAQDAKERFLDDPPRRMLMSCSLTQVVDSDTIRERFVFIFNDILIVAKPLESNEKAMNRLFLVKHIVDLKCLHVITQDVTSTAPMRHPFILRFIPEFNADPDSAVAMLQRTMESGNDEEALGKLLFSTYELDRTRVGAFLSKKSRRGALKAYIDCFGFAGVRIDHALRAFALTIQLPAEAQEYSSDYVLNVFATRWFDANAKIVSYDRDIAAKFVRIMVYLDSQMTRVASAHHNGGWRQRNFYAEWEGMVRTIDPRNLLPDELVHDIFQSLRTDPLRWAIQRHNWDDFAIGFKRAPPTTIVHRVQSDPITVQINRPDSELRIRLLSQEGITFDPPELNFARSTEASFRMTGTALGPKSIMFSLLGNNAQFYQGLPYSASLVVERPFMRHTFQIAFKDHKGLKRRYMFSTEDKVVCHQCIVYLRQSQLSKSGSGETEKREDKEMNKAVKALSLAALRDALSQKLSGHDIIMLCKQNSILIPLLSHVAPLPSSC